MLAGQNRRKHSLKSGLAYSTLCIVRKVIGQNVATQIIITSWLCFESFGIPCSSGMCGILAARGMPMIRVIPTLNPPMNHSIGPQRCHRCHGFQPQNSAPGNEAMALPVTPPDFPRWLQWLHWFHWLGQGDPTLLEQLLREHGCLGLRH